MLVYSDVVHVPNRLLSDLLHQDSVRFNFDTDAMMRYTGYGAPACDYLVVGKDFINDDDTVYLFDCVETLPVAVEVSSVMSQLSQAYGRPRFEVWVLDDRLENLNKCYRMAVGAC